MYTIALLELVKPFNLSLPRITYSLFYVGDKTGLFNLTINQNSLKQLLQGQILRKTGSHQWKGTIYIAKAKFIDREKKLAREICFFSE